MGNLFHGFLLKLAARKRLKRAQKLIMTGKYADACRLLEEITKQNPAHDDAVIWYAVAKNSLRDYEGAVKIIDGIIEKSSRKTFCKTVKGESLLLSGKTQEALNILTEALEENPDNTRIAYLVGICHTRLGNIENAAEFFELAVKYDRELVESRLLTMAEMYIHKNGR